LVSITCKLRSIRWGEPGVDGGSATVTVTTPVYEAVKPVPNTVGVIWNEVGVRPASGAAVNQLPEDETVHVRGCSLPTFRGVTRRVGRRNRWSGMLYVNESASGRLPRRGESSETAFSERCGRESR
jgi:hypothetical protein